ncbi:MULTISPECIES: YeeE/YedE family protein [Thermomonosporaceae]|uniref:YeeE/YedE family protein n=1 Tax=Thermomonosporaceae TaxID=2012 RepID=UPI00255A8446|nr:MULTISPECIES: YeeE/YedE family protein [Thermomonosporaceae]MDL4770976.1 YeeE/YedE family protein [Actinomadura xylanilytica]
MSTTLPFLRPPSPAVTSVPAPVPEDLQPVRRAPLLIASLGSLALTGYVWAEHGAKQGVLLLLGLGLGIALFHSRFGFTSAWRQLVAVGNGTGLRAHALLLGTTATLFALIIGTGTGLFGTAPQPSGGDLGVALLAGAFLFGIGMQLGGACASGTLFAVGSGQSTILLTLGGFIAGSILYSWQFDLVDDLPSVPGVLLSDHLGWFGSWAVTLAALAGIVALTRAVQARRTPPPVGAVPTARGPVRAVRGSWPLLAGALVLAVLGGAVLLVSGGAWGITSAFALWGAKFLQFIGLHPETWSYWEQPKQAQMLAGPVLADKTSLTDIGIMLGAAVASAAGGAWTLHRGMPWRTAVAAVLGGIIMGVGARLAGGCNIGAYLAGIASGSLHGWLWGAVALAGTWVGLRARTLFGLANPAPKDSVC